MGDGLMPDELAAIRKVYGEELRRVSLAPDYGMTDVIGALLGHIDALTEDRDALANAGQNERDFEHG